MLVFFYFFHTETTGDHLVLTFEIKVVRKQKQPVATFPGGWLHGSCFQMSQGGGFVHTVVRRSSEKMLVLRGFLFPVS